MKIFSVIGAILMSSIMMMNPALANKEAVRRMDSYPAMEPHLQMHSEVRDIARQLGLTYASPQQGASCTIDGVLAPGQPHHCRDYYNAQNEHYRIVFNGVTGVNGASKTSGETQKIYQIVKVDHTTKLVLLVRYENTQIVYSGLGDPIHHENHPVVAGGRNPVDQLNNEVGKAINRVVPGLPAGLGSLLGR